jgi:hypothetical protein
MVPLPLEERDMIGEVVRLDARRGIPGIGPEMPAEGSTFSTWVGGEQKPFLDWGKVSLTGETLGVDGVEYGIVVDWYESVLVMSSVAQYEAKMGQDKGGAS